MIAPYKCAVLPLSGHAAFKPFVKQICTFVCICISFIIFFNILADLLTQADISHKIDTSSSSIGKRYVRGDALAIPFAIAIDFDTLQEPHSVALREINSLKQIRVNVNV